MRYTDPQKAFETAIHLGRLCLAETHPLYAGDYMYMGDDANGAHLFKHRMTREYLPPVAVVS